MEAVDVLDRVDARMTAVLVDLLGQRKLDEDAGDASSALSSPTSSSSSSSVVAASSGGRTARCRPRGRLPACGGRRRPRPGRRRRARWRADRRADLRDLARHLGAHPRGQRLAVHQHGGHGRRRIRSSRVETARLPDEGLADGAKQAATRGVLRYYELAKRAEWQVRDLPWSELPPIPEYEGSAQKLARRGPLALRGHAAAAGGRARGRDGGAALPLAPHPEAQLYYTTMVQDESRHTEAWLKLADEAGGRPSAIRTSTSSRDVPRRRTRSRRRSSSCRSSSSGSSSRASG